MKLRDLCILCALVFVGVGYLAPVFGDVVAAPVAEPAQLLAPALERIAAMVERRRQEQGVPGVALVIVKDDTVVLNRGFGVRNVEKSLPVTPDTLFRIGSTTKAFTAMLAEMSVDDGKLALDDSPRRTLPYFKLRDPKADDMVTLRDFLCHRSGLKRTDLAWSTGALGREDVIRVLGEAQPTAPLGSVFQYNNVGFSVVGEAVAGAQGSSWETLVEQRIFEPLGMKASLTTSAQMLTAPDFAFSYRTNFRDRTAAKVTPLDTSNIAAATGLISNATDMGQWLRLMLNGGVWDGQPLVTRRGYAEMTSPQMKIDSRSQYGLGWYLEQWQGHKVVRHGGTLAGYRTEVALMPDQHLGFVMLANASSEPLQSSIDSLVWSNLVGSPEGMPFSDDERRGRPPEASEMPSPGREAGPQNVPLDGDDFPAAPPNMGFDEAPPIPDAWQALIASYRSAGGSVVEIGWRNGRAVFVVPSGKAYPLVPRGEDRFALAGLSDGFALRVQRDEQGQVSGLTLKQPVGDMTYEREPDFVSPVTVDDLMARVVTAAGGEENLRRHPARVTTFEAIFENEGASAYGTFETKAPDGAMTDLSLFAAGKPIGTVHEYFQGSGGGVDTNWNGAPFPSNPTPIFNRTFDSQNALDDQQLLGWKVMFKSIVIKRLGRVGNEVSYVVEKTPFRGNPITDYISATSFRLLKRETPVAGWVKGNETYSDYHVVDGVAVPFRIDVDSPRLGAIAIRVKSVRFFDDLPDADFGPKKP